MPDLFTRIETPYLDIYHSLKGLQETFHREGRISDSNAKLDETVKLLAVHFGRLRGFVSDSDCRTLLVRQTFTVRFLNQVFSELASNPIFQRKGMGSIFGETPSTIFKEGDETIAFELFVAAGQAFGAQIAAGANLDILNEAFGHYVRDNFRNHIEDAQYMTPPEVVDFMVDMAIEITKENHVHNDEEDFVFADPSCGVGSFLTRWRASYEQTFGSARSRRLKCIGQDKVERMVRLSAINLIFSNGVDDDVFLGNSIDDGSPISDYNGTIDVILTNPPFGARFSGERLKRTSLKSTPSFAKALKTIKSVDSELLFLDRYFTLLKPGGICLVIVPDNVISAKGLPALARQQIVRGGELIGVVELPSVTFAQAGTRTKTAVLGFRKKPRPRRSYPVFFSEATDIGFQVSKRKGISVKRVEGINQLHQIMVGFQSMSCPRNKLSSSVKATWKNLAPGENAAWTPRTVLFDRETLEHRTPYKLLKLKEFTEAPRRRKARPYTEKNYFISILHIIGEGILDIPGIKSYKPITPGLPVKPGEVLISRINPRIPRAAVVPELGKEILCSSEYEILTPKAGVSAYMLVFVLLSSFVQEQIQSLTAGTSASHSRVKPMRIYEVLVPDLHSAQEREVMKKLEHYEECCRKLTELLMEIEHVRSHLDLSIDSVA